MIDTFEDYVFKVDKEDEDKNIFLVPIYVVDKCIENGNGLLVQAGNDYNVRKQYYLSPFDLVMDKLEVTKTKYRFLYTEKYQKGLRFNPLIETEVLLLNRFHWSWFNVLRSYIVTDEFIDTISYINNLRDTKTIYPSLENVFRAFLETNFDFIKVCILGQDPYPNINPKGIPYANGIAFATETEDKPYSLLAMERAIKIDMDYPDNFILQNDLKHWIDQGIFLVNSALTVEKGKAGIHSKLWRKFIELVITKLDEKNTIFFLLGAEAKSFSKFITGNMFSALHPASAAYNETVWNSSGIFRQISDLSNELHGTGIKWII